eukprot:NODE_366_length_10082_cov_0.124211.p6 type:complete len:224 gc:universal NODE_366_length_10082_cov_0.124211:1245-574(-)
MVKSLDPRVAATPKSFGVGQSIQPKRDLTRFVNWPLYIKRQRQKAILKKRLKVPASLNQFNNAVDHNTAKLAITLFKKYSPETPQMKKERLISIAKGADKGPKPMVIKFGIKHITTLVEQKKAKLVLIAHDVDPIELVVWLPALCRKMGVPYMIVKGKARLGQLVHQKTVTTLALTEIKPEDQNALQNLTTVAKRNAEEKRVVGGHQLGLKTQARLRKRENVD